MELVLAVDVSWSMDIDEQRLQREGYVAAMRDPEVVATIGRGDWQRIAVTYVEWAGVDLQRTVVPWTIVDGPASANTFADMLDAAAIGRMRRTSISGALAHGALLFDNGIDGMRRVIDVSGDGPNNMGSPVTNARDAVVAQGITVNGLPIMIKDANPGGFFSIENLDQYYKDCVIGGFGAFMITVTDPAQFEEAIRRKIILEIAAATPRIVPAQFGTPEPTADCAVGEKQWRRWRRLDEW
ncbi:DUF1194 domain-containing protein [Acuticoccus sp.]|uniref:DUF1194 domain-containing protein n=1 Tax=Acuticoccus sp. TaxID=1904378 RepID=UPI003B515710